MDRIRARVDEIAALSPDQRDDWMRQFGGGPDAWPLERLMLLRDAEEHDSGMEHLWRLLDRRHEQLAAARQQVIALSRERAEDRKRLDACREECARLRSKLIEAGVAP